MRHRLPEALDRLAAWRAAEGEHAGHRATLVHCHASLSRSVAFILAHMMKTQYLTAAEAAKAMKGKWDAVWPNDTFVTQLLKYEDDLEGSRITPATRE